MNHLQENNNEHSSALMAMQDTAGEKQKKFKTLPSMNGNDPSQGKGLPRAQERIKKWNGWGYKDTEFNLKENGDVYVGGTRYPVSGEDLPHFRQFWEDKCDLDMDLMSPVQSFAQMREKIPKAQKNERFMQALQRDPQNPPYKMISTDDENRLLHGHGHSCQEIFALRYGKFNRVPDLVIYPGEHSHVERLVKLVSEEFSNEVMIIPYGGGTTVSQALLCPEEEQRFIISLDTQEMNRIKWIDHDNGLACIEAGLTGIEIERRLSEHGVTIGMEPDSYEFSTLGGWVATRASGMMKNTYGNIEDMVVSCKLVTPKGTVEVGCSVARKSTGPDITNIVIGSEGTLGIVTEAIVKIKKLPAVKEYGAIVFPDFASGVGFLRELADNRIFPTSVRLLDNMQFQFGQSLKLKPGNMFAPLMDWFKTFFLVNVKGFDPNELCACTVMYTGDSQESVDAERNKLLKIALKHKGIDAGGEAGQTGYLLTYVIAYLRDYGFNYYFMAESFETTIPWANVVQACEKVKDRIVDAALRRGVPGKPWACSRVSQIYDAGCCCYFYFGFSFKGLENPVQVYSEVESEARDEILAHGGSLSHHHGVGKLRAKWFNGQAISTPAFDMLGAVKKHLDPDNVFGVGNMGLSPFKVPTEDKDIGPYTYDP